MEIYSDLREKLQYQQGKRSKSPLRYSNRRSNSKEVKPNQSNDRSRSRPRRSRSRNKRSRSRNKRSRSRNRRSKSGNRRSRSRRSKSNDRRWSDRMRSKSRSSSYRSMSSQIIFSSNRSKSRDRSRRERRRRKSKKRLNSRSRSRSKQRTSEMQYKNNTSIDIGLDEKTIRLNFIKKNLSKHAINLSSSSSSSCSSPSPPRYRSPPPRVDNNLSTIDLISSIPMLGIGQSIFQSGKSIEECREQIKRQITMLNKQENISQMQSKISTVETIDLESENEDEEIIGSKDSKVVNLTNLNVNVTEMELKNLAHNEFMEAIEPPKISLTKFSGRCNARLQFNNTESANIFREKYCNDNIYTPFSPTFDNSPGVSPPRCVIPSANIQILDESFSSVRKTEIKVTVPIFVDIISDDGGQSLSKIKVHLYQHVKCQQFHGQEPKLLVSAFLNYMKKYYSSKDGYKFIFVTPCPASYILFYSVLKENAANKQVFDFYFSSWTDILSIVKSVQYDKQMLQGCFYQNNKEYFIMKLDN